MMQTSRRTVSDFDELYPGRFLKACDVQDKPTFTIERAWLEELEGQDGVQLKGIITFRDQEKDLVLNKTNGLCIREMFGRKLPEWSGKRVTFFAGDWNGEPAIRVWGSPDIGYDREVTIQLPRKRPLVMTMHATGAKPQASPKAKELSQLIRGAALPNLLEAVGKEVERALGAEEISLLEAEHLRAGYYKRLATLKEAKEKRE